MNGDDCSSYDDGDFEEGQEILLRQERKTMDGVGGELPIEAMQQHSLRRKNWLNLNGQLDSSD